MSLASIRTKLDWLYKLGLRQMALNADLSNYYEAQRWWRAWRGWLKTFLGPQSHEEEPPDEQPTEKTCV